MIDEEKRSDGWSYLYGHSKIDQWNKIPGASKIKKTHMVWRKQRLCLVVLEINKRKNKRM